MIVAIILPTLILFLFSPPHSGQNFAVFQIMCPQCSHGIKSFFGSFFSIM
nr:MAG TPA: zinc-ribbon domain protein [Caudoviricetes sp.]